MKTKAIKRCIDNGSDVRDALAAQVELYAIEAELIVKDEALRKCLSRTGIASTDPNGAGAEDVALIEIRTICKAALSKT